MLLYSLPRPQKDSCTVAIVNYSMFVSVFFVAFISCHQKRGKKEKKADQRLVLYHPDLGLACYFLFHYILRPFEAAFLP